MRRRHKNPDYHFITVWRIKAPLEEVAEILLDAEDLPRWWPSVYLSSQEISPGGPDGIGKTVRVWTKGWLPYTLKWRFVLSEANYPHDFTLLAEGEWEGRGIWSFEEDDGFVRVRYDWRVRPHNPLLNKLSILLRPIFSANHSWAMARGKESLKIELMRRHAASVSAMKTVPRPPMPTFMRLLSLLGRFGREKRAAA